MAGIALRGRVLTPLASGGVELIEDGVVAADARGVIQLVAPWRRARKKLSQPVRDLRPSVLVPGFVDAHLHYPQTRIIGQATGPLLDWLANSVFPEVGRFGLGLETSAAVLRGLVSLDLYGLPEDSLDTYRARVRAVDTAEAARVARAHLHPERLAIVLLGPASQLVPQLEGLGPVEVVEP